MVRFGHRSHRQEPAVVKSNAHPGSYLYSNTSKKEVGADGDLEDLIAQEIQRYEELYGPQSGNRDYAMPDDDTLQDGSIYTSMQGPPSMQGGMLHPLCANNAGNGNGNGTTNQPPEAEEEGDEDTMWGLPNQPSSNNHTVFQTSLLKPHEAAAAQACPMKSSSPVSAKSTTKTDCSNSHSKGTFVPPVPVLPIEQQQQAEDAPSSPVPAKKPKKKASLKRLFHVPMKVPSTPSSAQPTQASTKASTGTTTAAPIKINKFFSPAKKFFHPSSRATNGNNNKASGHPRNLIMAMSNYNINSNKNIATTNKKAGPPSPLPQPTTPHTNLMMSQQQQLQRRSPLAPPSPPPPMDHCEIQFGDGASVISTMTEAMEGWMHHHHHGHHGSSPPKIIGGGGMVTNGSPFSTGGKNISPIKLNVYDHNTSGATDGEQNGSNEHNNDEASEASPGALLLTEEGLYFHNHHGPTLSPVRIVRSSSDLSCSSPDPDQQAANAIQNNLVQMVWADKEQRELLKESKALMQSDVIPEDADPHYHHNVLGLHHHSVKRNLFGAETSNDMQDDDEDEQLDVSLAPLQHVITAVDEEEEDYAEDPALEDDDAMDDEKVAFALQQAEYDSSDREQHQPKASKFKRFLNKLVTTNSGNSPKAKQLQQEAQVKMLLEQERLKAKEALLERQRMEREETKRIQQKRQNELERQRKLELGSQDEPTEGHTSHTGNSTYDESDPHDEVVVKPRSFSLLTGEMKLHDPHQQGSQSSYTADITSSFPTVNTPSLSSLVESPKPTPREEVVPVSPAYTSTVVNFQFHREEGTKSFTMGFAVDTSEKDGMKWKDVVNKAWKADRKVVKSGVFSAIELSRIYLIREGELEMRFELPFWGKHASQTLGPKTLDLLLDVVGPQRPVMVTITLEEPQVAADGVDDEEAMEALFQGSALQA